MVKPRVGPNPLTRIVAAAPVGGALILSFNGLAELARLSRIDGWLAYLWPVTLDATGVVASLIWLDQKLPADARRSARWLALIAIVLSVAGNGLLHWLIDLGQRPHTFVQIGVGSVPPLVLFAMLHVLQLAYRRPASQRQTGQPGTRPVGHAGQPAPASPADWLARLVVHTTPAGSPAGVLTLPAPTIVGLAADPIPEPVSEPGSQPARVLADRLALVTRVRQPASPATAVFGAWKAHIDRAREVVARDPDIGRPALATELDVPESQARKLLAYLKANPNLSAPGAGADDTKKETASA